MKAYKLTICTLMMACISMRVYAESPHQHNAGLEAHVHGVAELTLAMEGKVLAIEFMSPAMNLIGFEHKAHTENDIAAVEQAESLLAKPDKLFLISGTSCTLASSSIDVSAILEEHHVDHHPAHEHESEHEDDHATEESHSEIAASFQYHCESMPQLDSISVVLFEHFPGVHQIRVMWVKEALQGAKTLKTTDNRIVFR